MKGVKEELEDKTIKMSIYHPPSPRAYIITRAPKRGVVRVYSKEEIKRLFNN